MAVQGITYDAFMATLEVAMNKEFTDEQRVLMERFDTPTICFSDAGTGKSTSACGGILWAAINSGIPAKNIWVHSFTRASTADIKNKYIQQGKRMRMSFDVNFSTLDSLFFSLIQKYSKFIKIPRGVMDKIEVFKDFERKDFIEVIADIIDEEGFVVEHKKHGLIYDAICSLNSAMIFDREHVEQKLVFVKTGLTFDEFFTIRQSYYKTLKLTKNVAKNDISLYLLEILESYPEICKELKSVFKIMIVDEFQDMPLIKLHILSLITDCLVVIGDIKQQIYGFNGATPEIVEAYKRYFPNAREVKLTQSFRCSNVIVAKASAMIAPNKMGGETFKGIERADSSVNYFNKFDVQSFAEEIATNYHIKGLFTEHHMFLYRNNASAVMLVDHLYKRKVPVRVSSYTKANEIPVMKDLCKLIELCKSPTTVSYATILTQIVPEFKKYKNKKNPLQLIMAKENISILDLEYEFKDKVTNELLLPSLRAASKLLKENAMCSDVLNALFRMYKVLYLSWYEQYLEQPATYYINLVKPLVQGKTYTAFIYDENEKQKFILDCESKREGLCCYTAHSAKGLEADIIHILDADSHIFPNTKKLEDTLNKGCVIEAAIDIRAERSLAFVAVTRAKRVANIYYDTELSSLFTEVNNFLGLDTAYETSRKVFDDVGALKVFFEIEGGETVA